MLAPDLRGEARWLSSGFLLVLCSGFGQTYFIAIFAGHLKGELGLSDGDFGSLYAVGTLSSAALLMWAGKFADTLPTRTLGLGVLAGLALTSVAMASVASGWMLLFVLFGLRFFGQGMLTHVAMTAMGRWFNRKRGRAVSIAALGFPAGEALLPVTAVALMSVVGWRLAWVAVAAALLALAGPALAALLRRERTPAAAPAPADGAMPHLHRHEWTRGEVLRSPLFYALLPGVMAQPFIQTGIFFNQVAIVEMKGWELSWLAASFPILAGVNVAAALATGWAIDRWGARRLLAAAIVPLGLATLVLTYGTSAYLLPVFMALVGVTGGGVSTILGALWAELYGTTHLGAIRVLGTAAIVVASAISPGLIGILMDAGVALQSQLLAMAVLCLLIALWMALLAPRLRHLRAGPAGPRGA